MIIKTCLCIISIIRGNSQDGIYITGNNLNHNIEYSFIKHNGGNGIRLEGGTSNQPVNLTIESSSVNDNDNAGIRQSSNYSSLLINYSNITNNVGEGVYVEGIASVTNSILWNNRYLGDLNQVSSNSGVTNIEHSSIMGLYTYGLYPIYGTSGQFMLQIP